MAKKKAGKPRARKPRKKSSGSKSSTSNAWRAYVGTVSNAPLPD